MLHQHHALWQCTKGESCYCKASCNREQRPAPASWTAHARWLPEASARSGTDKQGTYMAFVLQSALPFRGRPGGRASRLDSAREPKYTHPRLHCSGGVESRRVSSAFEAVKLGESVAHLDDASYFVCVQRLKRRSQWPTRPGRLSWIARAAQPSSPRGPQERIRSLVCPRQAGQAGRGHCRVPFLLDEVGALHRALLAECGTHACTAIVTRNCLYHDAVGDLDPGGEWESSRSAAVEAASGKRRGVTPGGNLDVWDSGCRDGGGQRMTNDAMRWELGLRSEAGHPCMPFVWG